MRPSPTGRPCSSALDARGVLASCGMPSLVPQQLPRWRAALDDARGEAVERAFVAGGLVKCCYPSR